MNDTQDKIGKLLTGREERDAIHIAVLPAKAGQDLSPGHAVSYDPATGEAFPSYKNSLIGTIGIVDPFLRVTVQRGQYFWIFLYPNTVTGMRHHWLHPGVEKAELAHQVEGRQYLESFAAENNVSYDELVDGLESGEVYFGDDTEAPSNAYHCKAELFAALSKVTGKSYDEDHVSNTFFRCAC